VTIKAQAKLKNMATITPSFNQKQKQAMRLLMDHTNGVNEVMFGGGAGGGKSYLGCLWLITNSIKNPGTRWMIGGKELKKIKQTTMKSFFEVCKQLGINETAHFKYNDQKGEIKFFNGSEILLMDLDGQPSDPEFEFLGSIEITGAFIDEAARISEKAKDMVMSRIRYKLDEYKMIPKLLMSCNPSRNWCYNSFYRKNEQGNLEPYKKFVQSLVSDNEFISKHYITSLQRLDGITKSRLLYGSWDYQDSLALFNYDSLSYMFEEFKPNESEEKPNHILSIDVAHMGKDKTVIFVWDGLSVVEIDEMEKKTFPEQAARIQALCYKYTTSFENIVIDLDGLSAGLYDLLPGAKGIHNNGKTIGDADFLNLKTQLYYKLAELINTNQIKVNCNQEIQTKLMQELQVVKRTKVDSDGKIQMTSKDEVKRLISRSPDYSDAMAYRMLWILQEQEFDYSFYVI